MEAAALSHVPVRRGGRFLRGASDGDLVTRMRAGDDTAFEAIYDRYHRGLFAFCRHMLSSRDEAEDALQHVFLAVHRNLRDTARPVALKPWLYAVARNRCLNMLAARREGTPLDDVAEPSTDGLAVAAAVEQRADLRELLGDLAGLPDDQRAALLLAELGDLSHEEIADALEVRREKVKALVFQARTSLMNAREAREVDCREIQEQLATMSGADLRRGTLRKHVAMCPSCAAYKAEVRRQRAALALVLPVLPAATLKGSVFSAVFGTGSAGGAAATAGAGAGVGAAASSGGVLGAAGLAKTIATIAIVGGIGGGGVVAVRQLDRHKTHPAAPVVRPAPAQGRAHDHAAAGARATVPARPAPTRKPSVPARAGAAAGSAAASAPVRPGKSATAHSTPSAFGQQTAATHGRKLGHGVQHSSPAATHTPASHKPARPVHPAHPAQPAKPAPSQKPAAKHTPPATGQSQGPTAASGGQAQPATGHTPAQHPAQPAASDGQTSTTGG